MKASWYERQGPPSEVLVVGEMTAPELGLGGSIATYATGDSEPAIPFWSLVFKNARLFFLGSDDFSATAKIAAARALNEILEGEWPGFEIGAQFPLELIAEAHEVVEERRAPGRVVVNLCGEKSARYQVFAANGASAPPLNHNLTFLSWTLFLFFLILGSRIFTTTTNLSPVFGHVQVLHGMAEDPNKVVYDPARDPTLDLAERP